MLKHDFLAFYGSIFLNKLKLEIDYNNPYCWIKEFLSKKYKASHPLKHILFLIFLCKNDECEIMKLFTDNSEYSLNLFGESPWPCLNPVANHYLENVITDYSITTSPKTRMPIGIFECSCGFIYTKHIPLEAEIDNPQYQSVKAYGHVWEEELSKTILYEGGTLRSVALKMHCDSKTVKRYASKLGLTFCWESHSEYPKQDLNKINCQTEYREHLCNQYRTTIQNYILSFPSPPRIYQIRELYEREYKYLYKHNKEMLFDLLITCKNNTNITIKKSKVNWEKRDLELLPLISNEIEKLFSSDKINRITINKIGRDLGISYILEQYLDKLPKTSLLINTTIESIEEYQIRRIRTIADKLVQNNESIFKTKLYRFAGLKNTCSDNVKQEINKLLKIRDEN